MPLNRRFRLSVVLLAASMLVLPAPAAAADPTLGEAVTLPDGTVLPPMPPEMLGPSIHSEMDAEHGRPGRQRRRDRHRGAPETRSWSSAAPLVVAEATATGGPGGSLPNGLTHEVLGFLPHWKLDATTLAALRYDLLSTIAYFGIGAQTDGSLVNVQSRMEWVGVGRNDGGHERRPCARGEGRADGDVHDVERRLRPADDAAQHPGASRPAGGRDHVAHSRSGRGWGEHRLRAGPASLRSQITELHP